ncbi:coiled-coil domain-containing protein 33 [Balearica regulorum gibbericeps]|uniref:coiled-coil domain-containing protein 33 n=1 Tax=Balearica regulorum gibbericeps TaxID=100784 RepID=UPI003F637D14
MAGEPRVPLTLHRSRLKAEEKTLDFEFEVISAQFNRLGRYALRLTVENPLLRGSGAGVQLRNDGEVTQSSTGTTDTIEQNDLNQIYSFQKKKFTFTLPRGFCKNDKNHDVRLHVEALRFPGRAQRMMKRSRLVGEAFFAIYPRTNQPRMKVSAGRDEDWYRYSAVMALLRVGSEQPAMHCGRLAFTASLHEHRPPTTLASPPPLSPSAQGGDQQAAAPGSSPTPDIPVPSRSLRTPESAYHSLPTKDRARSSEKLRADRTPSSSPELRGDSADEHPSSSSSSSLPALATLSRSSFHLSSPRYSPDPTSSPAQVSESPAGMEEPRHAPGASGGHVARVGKEAISVILHGASNLPATRDGRVPRPYVVVVTSGGDERKAEARATHASSAPTHAPTWEEELTVEMDAEDAGRAALTLTVADKATKEALGTFQLPVRHLQPFQPHRCKLVLPRARDPTGTVLHVTVIRKGTFIPRCGGLSYVALEVLLQGLSAPLAAPPEALVAVARVVTNVQEYKHRMEKHPVACPGISPTTVTFPDPPASAFSIARAANHGYPQMSRPAGTPEQPTWDTSFLFHGRDVATIFSEDTALAIEYYPYKAIWDAPGTLIPMGYSVLPLTSRVFRELAAQSGGMRVDGLAVRGAHPKTTTGTIPTVGLCLRLLRSERPPAFLTPSGSDALPSPDPVTGALERGRELRAAPVRPFYGQLHRDDVSLPAADAVASILPGKQPFPHRMGAPAEQRRSQVIGDHQEPESVGEAGGAGGSGGTGGDSSIPKVGPGYRGDRNQAAVGSTLPAIPKAGSGGPRELAAHGFPRPRSPLPGSFLQPSVARRDSAGPGRQWGASSSALGWQEVGSYHLALRRMAGDLLSLRRHVASLEVENGHLRRSLTSQEELGHALLDDADLDVMTREELLDRLATLKRKLVAGAAEMRRLKDRVQQLQNELIRKNDQEKDLVLLQRAHRQQQAALRRCQEKVAKTKGLEETVRQQEKVIEAMERMLQEKLAGMGRSTEKPAGEALSEEAHAVLLAENRRLREELARPPNPSPPIAPRPPALLDGFGGAEKLSLLARLEEAQARGRVLERQPAWFGSVPAGGGGEKVGTGEAGAGHSAAGEGARLPPRPRLEPAGDPHGDPPEKTPGPPALTRARREKRRRSRRLAGRSRRFFAR